MSDKEVYIKVTKDGPYLLFGMPEVSEEIILTDESGECIGYGKGKNFEIRSNPVALCRCGKSKNAPFCDLSHQKIGFDGTETASFEPLLDGAVKFHGKNLVLSDNEKYCALARFCDVKGTIWTLITKGDESSDKIAIEEANLCPSGRLVIFDKDGNEIEYELEKSVTILEDEGLKVSGPLWLKGGIRVESVDGRRYEVRNRQTLCRCGMSSNKPFCNCAHAHNNFKAKNNNDL